MATSSSVQRLNERKCWVVGVGVVVVADTSSRGPSATQDPSPRAAVKSSAAACLLYYPTSPDVAIIADVELAERGRPRRDCALCCVCAVRLKGKRACARPNPKDLGERGRHRGSSQRSEPEFILMMLWPAKQKSMFWFLMKSRECYETTDKRDEISFGRVEGCSWARTALPLGRPQL
jgi:hypothetical protein